MASKRKDLRRQRERAARDRAKSDERDRRERIAACGGAARWSLVAGSGRHGTGKRPALSRGAAIRDQR